MQDLKIEYRDGKLVELSIDGMSFRFCIRHILQSYSKETLPTSS